MSASVNYSEYCNQDALVFTGMHCLMVFADDYSLLRENPNIIIVDPSAEI
jgi:hypothetical protein